MTGADSGEVSVRQDGQVTVLDAPELDGAVRIDLDYESAPHVRVPADTEVSFSSPDGELSTDGGELWSEYGARRIKSRGWALREDHAAVALAAGVFGLVGGGTLLPSSGSEFMAGLLLLVLGGAAAYVGARSKWSGTAVEADDE
ncbi:hypothetical protein GCM10009037_07080 [Halarchaeum grantii]|uniref:Uncharacterized protein n=1 Tax=Halarchaeum grantii TaxID=1193105 RepID=A0A830EUJ3_9EURY|nr:hypothetical protein [Halarchaeum grantii]GGL26025.1 hypothetical protein GCM10009037_07080 [Halarchaeum grantii]